MAFCIPVGMPIISTPPQALVSKYLFDSRSLQLSFRLSRWHIIIEAERYWAITLAIATPSAAFLHTTTKKMFRITFSTPAIERYTNGFFVSPQALRTPFPKLYTAMAGIPSAYILR